MFVKPSEVSGGGNFFRPKELSTALALLFEPKTVLPDQPRTYNGIQTGTGTDVITDITVFGNQSALDNGQPTEILKNVAVDKAGVVSRLEKIIGQAMVGRMVKTPTKAGNTAWVVDDIDEETTNKVAAYFTARSEAAAAAPSFDD